MTALPPGGSRRRNALAGTWLASGLFALAALAAAPAFAQEATDQNAAAAPASEPAASDQGLWERSTLLGDPFGWRSRVADQGITLGVQEQSEVLGNATGGTRQGAAYEGATQMQLGIDLEKLVGLPGGKFNVSAYQIHGRGLTSNNLDSLDAASGIEAKRGTRLFELWYEQSLFDDALSVRVGQMAADQEFIVSTYGALFINAGFGWPTLAASDLPGGGPAYPSATPGVRLKWQATENLTALLGVFNGDPADNGAGTSMRLNKGAFVIGELQYAINQGDDATGLPGTYKIGAWYNSNKFNDLYYSTDGLSLANPASNGNPLVRRNDWSLYAVADQAVWQVPGGEKGQGIGVFGRVMGAPSDRNLINFFANAGATYKGPIPGRGDDSLGLALAYARIGDSASRLDTSTQFYSGGWVPVRRNETVLELTYQAQVTPWLSLQPDFQYIFNPGGGLISSTTGKRIGDAAVFGLRTTVLF